MNVIPLLCSVVTIYIIILAFCYDLIEPNNSSSPSEVYYSLTQGNGKPLKQQDDNTILNEEYDKIFWFIQLTDIHISIFRDLKRGSDLIQFCQSQISVIRPKFVIVSGDIVDAKTENLLGSQQYFEEWKIYQQVTNVCARVVNGQWFDIRGNHDVFDVPNVNSSNNYFRRYTTQRKFSNQTSYMFNYTTSYGRYAFIGIDACLSPGLRRPFNFFGRLQDGDIKQLLDYSHSSRKSNLTIWFSHYPTAFIIYPDLRSIMRRGIAHLSGHLHTLGGLVPNMYTRQKTGMLELELGDWKDNRMFRLLAIDHDILSFTDEEINTWPLVLITNPKHALFMATKHEPLYRIATSTHIRILAFSPNPIKYVNVSINDVFLGTAQHVKDMLFVLPWQPAVYSKGLHTISVSVADWRRNNRTVQQPFSVDNTQPSFRFVSKFLLMVNHFTVGKVLFWSLFSSCLVVLIVLRNCRRIRSYLFFSDVSILNKICDWCNYWILLLWKLTQVNSLFYIVLFVFVYTGIGPWFIGEFLENEIGAMFVWGIIVMNSYIPGSFTYFFGILQILTFNIPLTFYVSYYFDKVRHKYECWTDSNQNAENIKFQLPMWWLLIMEIPFICLFLFQFYLALTGFPKAYGHMAFYTCPVRTWCALFLIVINIYTYRLACRNPSPQRWTAS
ncbi:transmembrane protein 62-like [Argonauta hians]